MDDLLSEFLTETAESLAALDVELVKLEQNPNDPELVSSIFRLVHTIKGTCGFLGLPRLESLAHAGENVLGKIRDGELVVTPEAVTLVLEALDQIKALLAILESTESEPEGNDQDLISRLNAFAAGEAAVAKVAPKAEAPSAPAAEPAPAPKDDKAAAAEAMMARAQAASASATDVLGSLYDQLGGAAAIKKAVEVFYVKVLGDSDLKPFFENVNMDVLKSRQETFLTKVLGGPDKYDGKDMATAHAALVAKGLNDSHFDKVAHYLQETLVEVGAWGPTVEDVMNLVATTRDDILGRGAKPKEAAAPAAASAPAPVPAAAKPPAAKAASKEVAPKGDAAESAVAASSIRVSVELLENLMTTVSELVLTRNQLMQILRSQSESEFAGPLQRLNLITSELQEGVMKTRMQPIGNAWAKLPRIVRDLSVELNKKIDLVMKGAETELDRQVLELIKDPLTHMVRNSADHGIEGADLRAERGKPETGTITLNAFHEGGHIIIEIADDGGGLSVSKIRAKAIEKGLASESELDGMSEQQIQSFIMRAGFSTAAKVTSVSGRGVGMDVVKTNIEKIGGTIEVQSTEGKGSNFIIKIPLTLAIVSALIVECSGERFAIPQISVLELVRASSQSEQSIEMINNTPLLRLRNRLLPLVSLRAALKLKPKESTAKAKQRQLAAGQGVASLYERVGGEGAIKAAVQIFYEKVLADKNLKKFFANTDMDRLRLRQESFFAKALGGPDKYDGKDMVTAHADLVRAGLNDSHFDAVAGHLQSTLQELGVDSGLIGEIIAVVATTRDAVLGRVQAPAKKMDAKKKKETAKESANGAGVLEGEQFIVVSQVGTYTFGIIVDRVFDTEEIVVKPVAPILRHISLFSGNTILGDGSVIMILDPNGIASSTGDVAKQAGADALDAQADARRAGSDQAVSLLLFRAGDESPKAVPLALIARLEEIDLSKVERTHGVPMVQYRGHLMPLIPINEDYQLAYEGRQPVLVFSDRERSMGLVVDEIVDIVESHANVELSSDKPGILGSAIIAEKATDMIDTGFYLTKAFKDWFGNESSPFGEESAGRSVLLVDDSPFFRNLIKPMLSAAGYRVSTVESAQQALNLCEQGRVFDVIISDIEMPGMNGFDFAKAVRSNPRWKDVPLVALSSHASKEDIERGRAVGFTDYVPKSDREGLLESLAETMAMERSA